MGPMWDWARLFKIDRQLLTTIVDDETVNLLVMPSLPVFITVG